MHHKTLQIFFAFLCFLVYAVVGAPVQLSQLTKRNYQNVQEAIHGLHHQIGKGAAGRVYSLKQKYKGHDAVVKVIDRHETGPRKYPPAVEAHNAHQVGQLLDHGHDTTNGRDTHYLVMKNMGVPGDKSGLSPKDNLKLNDQAKERYAQNHGVQNEDGHEGNFVYRKNSSGHMQAEIIDWANVKRLGTHPEVPSLQVHQVEGPASFPPPKKAKCSNCVIQ